MNEEVIYISESNPEEHQELMDFFDRKNSNVWEGSRDFEDTLAYPYLWFGGGFWVGHTGPSGEPLTTKQFLLKYQGVGLSSIYD